MKFSIYALWVNLIYPNQLRPLHLFWRSFWCSSACNGFEDRLFLLSPKILVPNCTPMPLTSLTIKTCRSFPNLPLGSFQRAHNSDRGSLRKRDSRILGGVALINKFVPRDQFCWRQKNQWTKIGSWLWTGMMELVNIPWRSPICRIYRLGTSNLENIKVIQNSPLCDPMVGVSKHWIGEDYCMVGGPPFLSKNRSQNNSCQLTRNKQHKGAWEAKGSIEGTTCKISRHKT